MTVTKFVSPAARNLSTMRLKARRPFIDVEFGGEKVQVLLDTGAPDNLVLSGRAARKVGVDWKSLPDFGRVGTTVGPMEVRLHESEVFRFAGFEFGTIPILVAPKGWYNIGGNTDSALGFDVLRQFVVRLDYPRQRMWLKRTGDPKVTYLGVDYSLVRLSGAYVGETADGYVVVGIVPESPAARIGLRPGDVPVNAVGEGAFRIEEFIRRIESGEEITVARQQGKIWVDVVLPEAESD